MNLAKLFRLPIWSGFFVAGVTIAMVFQPLNGLAVYEGLLTEAVRKAMADQFKESEIKPGGLEKAADSADIVFKGQVLSSTRITNEAFQCSQMEVHETKLKVISVLKGEVSTNVLFYQHYVGWTSGPRNWSGPSPPEGYKLEAGQSYLIFAARMDKPDWYYAGIPSATNSPDKLRQHTSLDHSIIRLQDARPVNGLMVTDAIWLELNLLLNSDNPTNTLYAISHLDAFSTNCGQRWGHINGYKRAEVLKVLLPFTTNLNDQVALAALGCYQSGSDCATPKIAFVSQLISIANHGPTTARRVSAIRALAGTEFEAVSNSIPQWVHDPSEEVRMGTALSLADFPAEFSRQALRELAKDRSAKVRETVAEAIGNGKIARLLPTLVELLSDPAGLEQPIPPLTVENIRQIEQLPQGGRVMSIDVGDVHTAAAYALLKFNLDQVSNILVSNLSDSSFKIHYLCKLADGNAGPWLTNLVKELEARRIDAWKKVEASSVEPKTNYFRSQMYLSGIYFKCWNVIYNHLLNLQFEAFANGRLDWCLHELENAGDTGSREPVMLYELYKKNGLNRRAGRFRAENGKYVGYNLAEFFDRIDEKYSHEGNKPPDQ